MFFYGNVCNCLRIKSKCIDISANDVYAYSLCGNVIGFYEGIFEIDSFTSCHLDQNVTWLRQIKIKQWCATLTHNQLFMCIWTNTVASFPLEKHVVLFHRASEQETRNSATHQIFIALYSIGRKFSFLRRIFLVIFHCCQTSKEVSILQWIISNVLFAIQNK